MKKYTLILATILSLLITVQSWGGDFQTGFDAYDRGDYLTALKEWKPLAEQGDENAQFFLGVMYYQSRGVTQDYKKAFKWYTLSAEQGNPEAQSSLGFIYYWGLGAPQDYEEALKWYSLSAKQGYAEAQYALGNMYGLENYGDGDFVYTYMWWNISSSNGNDKAKRGLKMVQKAMTYKDIEKAQRLARECISKNYIGC